MDTLRGIECFVRAVEQGSIAAAARLLGISPAAASQNIARLEASLEVRLLTRTTRNLALTEMGDLYYRKVGAIVQDLEHAHEMVTALHSVPQGRLVLTSSAAFGRHVIAPLLPGFNTRYPRVNIELATTDRNVDHIREGVDISIRTKQQLEDNLVARQIASVPYVFCASPHYLTRAGTPERAEDLRNHDCLVFRTASDGRLVRWDFSRNGKKLDVDVRVKMISDDIDVLARLAAAGGGVTRLAGFIAKPYLRRNNLKALFLPKSDETGTADIAPLDFYLCVHDRYGLTPKTRAFANYIAESLPEEWQVKKSR